MWLRLETSTCLQVNGCSTGVVAWMNVNNVFPSISTLSSNFQIQQIFCSASSQRKAALLAKINSSNSAERVKTMALDIYGAKGRGRVSTIRAFVIDG